MIISFRQMISYTYDNLLLMFLVTFLCNFYYLIERDLFSSNYSIILCARIFLSLGEPTFDVSFIRAAIKAFLFKHRFAGLLRIIC